MSTLQVKIERSAATNLVSCVGDMIGAEALDFKTSIKPIALQNKNLCLDLTEVNDISLTGLNSILMAKAWSNASNNKVSLILPQNSKVLAYLKMAKMTEQFIIEFKTAKIKVA